MTLTEDRDIAMAAMTGETNNPMEGARDFRPDRHQETLRTHK